MFKTTGGKTIEERGWPQVRLGAGRRVSSQRTLYTLLISLDCILQKIGNN